MSFRHELFVKGESVMRHEDEDLPEVGSKWVVLAGYPQGARISAGSIVSVSGFNSLGSVVYLDNIGYEWVSSPHHWHENFRPLEQEKAPTESTAEASLMEEPSGKIASDGGSSAYYDFPKGCDTLNDLIEHKGMSFAQGNIFKAAYRLGNKEGISLEYDLKKIKYYADRMLNQIKEGE